MGRHQARATSQARAGRMWAYGAVLLAMQAGSSLGAQAADPLQVGARVSVAPSDSTCRSRWRPCTRGAWLGGTLTRVTSDTLVLQFGPSGTVAVARDRKQQIFLSLGRSRPRSAIRSAISNALLTYLIADLTDAPQRSTVGWTSAMAGAGLVTGALFPVERWRRVRE